MKKFLLMSMIVFSSMVVSCSADDNHYFNISTHTINFNEYGGTDSRYLTSNTSWYFKKGDSWITISPSSGTGDAMVDFIISENNSSSPRVSYVEYEYGSSRGVIQVEQKGRSTGGGGNTGGGNNGNTGGNTGGGSNDNTGGSTDGGNTGGGNSQQKPSTPTGVSVSNEGSAAVPSVIIRWNAVSGASKYYVYKSSSANGSYSKIGETSYTAYADSNAPTNGASAYYKVKAVNSAGESAFSDYALYTSEKNDTAFSPAYTYGSCTVSGTTMTLRWTNSSGFGYGKATSIVLRVWNPFAEEWQDTQLSATATSASFNFSTKIDSYGYVKAGIVVSNDKGSFTAGAKIYDTKSKKWLN